MAPRTKTLKKCIIAYTDDIPIPKRDKIKGWVEHAGGAISKEITDNVTHLILTKRDWKDYTSTKVKEARSRKTIYLVDFAWLEDSLANNKSKRKPLDEKKYAWEVKHAEKVMKHRNLNKAEKRKEASRARMLAARQEREQSEEGDVGDGQTDEAPATDGSQQDITSADDPLHGDQSSSKSIQLDLDIKSGLGKRRNQDGVRKRRSVKEKTAAGDKIQQFFECGIKFDKSILETERNMTLAGYRPYIDPNGVVHMIMLVRNDIQQILQEQYKLKSPTSLRNSYCKPALPAKLDNAVTKDSVTRKRRRRRARNKNGFDAGKDTRLRYFEDPICCKRSSVHSHTSSSIDKLNDGQYTPIPKDGIQFDSHRIVTEWVNDHSQHHSTFAEPRRQTQHTPFSSLPVMPYMPMSTLHPQIRVPLPQPFAYSLQLYESTDLSKSSSGNEQNTAPPPTTKSEPSSPTTAPETLVSFAQYLPQNTLQDPSQDLSEDPPPSPTYDSPQLSLTDPISTTTTSSSVTLPPPKKTYLLLCQYTKKGSSRASVTTTLAPEGSTFVFAMDMFRKVFRKKTGLSWDEVKGGREARGGDFGVGSHGDGDRDSDGGLGSLGSLETGITSSKTLERREPDSMSVSSGTIQCDDPVPVPANSPANFTEAISVQQTNTSIPPSSPSPPLATDSVNVNIPIKPETSEPNNPAPITTPWTLSSSKDVGRAGYRPFSYVATDRKTFEESNERYRALHGENLFLFPGDKKGEGDGEEMVVKREDVGRE